MILIVAWDGGSLDVLRPFVDAGEMPNFAELEAAGASRRLLSTWPPVTFPAWSSFLTAAGPDRHGLTDFTLREGYGVRFANASHRRLPSIFATIGAAGGKTGTYAVPVTYPPDPECDLVVCGFDTPLGGGRLSRRTQPTELAARLEKRYGGLAVDGPQQSKIEPGWHDRALAEMLDTIERRTDIVCDLLAEHCFDAFMVHYGESDTVSHQFWQFVDAQSPRARDGGPSYAMRAVYTALDRALGRLLECAGAQDDVMLLSDHGSGGASDRVVFWNRWLADRGYLTFEPAAGGASMTSLAKRAALALVPPRFQASLFEALPSVAGRIESGARLGGIDWSRTQVFSEELNYFPALWINERGREPMGVVESGERDALVERLVEDLHAFVDPIDGLPVVDRVLRREDVYDGEYAQRIPDLFLELREPGGYTYNAQSSRGGRETASVRRLRAEEMTGARGTTMSGSHRMEGLCVVRGPGIEPGARPDGAIADAGATVLALRGLAPVAGADGRAWADLGPRTGGAELTSAGEGLSVGPESDYDEEDERAVAERLRALGYLE